MDYIGESSKASGAEPGVGDGLGQYVDSQVPGAGIASVSAIRSISRDFRRRSSRAPRNARPGYETVSRQAYPAGRSYSFAYFGTAVFEDKRGSSMGIPATTRKGITPAQTGRS